MWSCRGWRAQGWGEGEGGRGWGKRAGEEEFSYSIGGNMRKRMLIYPFKNKDSDAVTLFDYRIISNMCMISLFA